jgi:hypothetical protein
MNHDFAIEGPMIRTCMLFLFAVAMSGCALRGPDIAGAPAPSITRSFTLENNYIWQPAGEMGVILAKGTYVSEKETEQGTFFRGPKRCVAYQVVGGYTVTSGGVWIPRSPKEKLRLVTYAYVDETRVREPAEAIALMAAAAAGEKMLPAPDNGEPTITVRVPVAITPMQGAVGAGIGGGIVNAINAAEIRDLQGKPFLQWELKDAKVESLMRDRVR